MRGRCWRISWIAAGSRMNATTRIVPPQAQRGPRGRSGGASEAGGGAAHAGMGLLRVPCPSPGRLELRLCQPVQGRLARPARAVRDRIVAGGLGHARRWGTCRAAGSKAPLPQKRQHLGASRVRAIGGPASPSADTGPARMPHDVMRLGIRAIRAPGRDPDPLWRNSLRRPGPTGPGGGGGSQTRAASKR